MRISRIAPGLLLAASLISAPAQAALRFFMPFTTGPYALGGPLGMPVGTAYVGDISGNDVTWSYGPGAGQPTLFGGAMVFDGVDDYIQVNLDVNPSAMPQMTWGAWVKTTQPNPSFRQFLSNDNGGYDRTLGIDVRAALPGAYSAFTGNGVLGDSQVAAQDTWNFVAAAYDQTAGTMQLWVDGRRTDGYTSFGEGLTSFAIGMNPGHGEYFQGSIYNVFVVDQLLNDAQIEAIRLGGAEAILGLAAPVPEPQTWALWLTGLGMVAYLARRARPGLAARACDVSVVHIA